MLQANINLSVPALPDNQVWFANSAAWSNYWKDINVNVVFNPAASVIYPNTNFNAALPFVAMNIDGVIQNLPSYDQFNSLLTAFIALQTDYVALKTVLKNAGFITQV